MAEDRQTRPHPLKNDIQAAVILPIFGTSLQPPIITRPQPIHPAYRIKKSTIMRSYGTFLSPTSPSLPRSQDRAWIRTVSTQSSDSDDATAETRAILRGVIYPRHDLLNTARADANFLAAMVTVLGLVVLVVYGGVSLSGVMEAFVGMIRGLLDRISLGHYM